MKMKALFILVMVFLSFGYLTPARADFQSENELIFSEENLEGEKVYLPWEKLRFSKEGIFLLTHLNTLISLGHLNHDQLGYYIAGGRLSTYIFRCNNCNAAYQNRMPQPCESCDKSLGGTLDYEDIWNRN